MQQCRFKSFLPGNHNGYDIIFTLRLSYLYYVHRNFFICKFFFRERWKNMWHSRAFKSFHLRCFNFFVMILFYLWYCCWMLIVICSLCWILMAFMWTSGRFDVICWILGVLRLLEFIGSLKLAKKSLTCKIS